MGVARKHMHGLYLLSGDFKIQYRIGISLLIHADFSLLNQAVARHHDKKFPLGMMPVLSLRHARPADIYGKLTAFLCL